jgi:sugar lactone lactonase YvrE
MDIPWGQMPGIAVDKQDNVWIYTRTNPTIHVYAPDGH